MKRTLPEPLLEGMECPTACDYGGSGADYDGRDCNRRLHGFEQKLRWLGKPVKSDKPWDII